MTNSILKSIAVTVEHSSGNVAPLLHEIRHALRRLLAQGASSSIDLMALPLAPGEEQQILTQLGRGEVHATLQALGTSEVLETAYPGVWLITHRDERDEVLARFIEICRIPDILSSQDEDIALGAERLDLRLSTTDPCGNPL